MGGYEQAHSGKCVTLPPRKGALRRNRSSSAPSVQLLSPKAVVVPLGQEFSPDMCDDLADRWYKCLVQSDGVQAVWTTFSHLSYTLQDDTGYSYAMQALG